MSLSKLAGRLEATILAMPIAEQVRAKESVVNIVTAARGLADVPPEAMNIVWKILVAFVPRAALGGKGTTKQMVRQIVEGAPRLLPPDVRHKIIASVEEG